MVKSAMTKNYTENTFKNKPFFLLKQKIRSIIPAKRPEKYSKMVKTTLLQSITRKLKKISTRLNQRKNRF